jgi:regulator of RNase E activity RraA
MKLTKTILFISLIMMTLSSNAQNIAGSPEYIKALTAKWTGERFEDGRPKVSDNMLERLKKVTIEEAWAELMKLGYQNQYEGDWMLLHEREDAVMTGRAVTAQFMPMRPDLEDQIIEQGKKEGRMWQQKRTVSWVINSLRKGDVYVADTYNKEFLGTAIGSNLGKGVYSATGNGMVTYGHIRDMERLRKLDGFNVWCKGYDPSYMRQTILTNYNVPVRIGKAIVLPGDAVLAKPGAVLFIPAHLVEHIVLTSEFTALSDEFGEEMIDKGIYTAGEIDSMWDKKMNDRFVQWLNDYQGTLPMTKDELERYLKARNF